MKKTLFAVCFVFTAAIVQAQTATPERQPASANFPGVQCPRILPDSRVFFPCKSTASEVIPFYAGKIPNVSCCSSG